MSIGYNSTSFRTSIKRTAGLCEEEQAILSTIPLVRGSCTRKAVTYRKVLREVVVGGPIARSYRRYKLCKECAQYWDDIEWERAEEARVS